MGLFATVREDIRAVFERDPAARTALEVVLCYPGLHAIWCHRIAHRLHRAGLIVLSRLLSNLARFFTGIEIHPGARIGRRLVIDHGMGVVVGETTEIGNDVTLYQGVTLGGTGKEKGKRHPTIEDNVLIGTGARILGNITVGANSKIGAGAVVLRDVPPNCTVVGNPGQIVVMDGRRVGDLDHVNLPDPVGRQLESLQQDLIHFERRLHQLEVERDQLKKQVAERIGEEQAGVHSPPQ